MKMKNVVRSCLLVSPLLVAQVVLRASVPPPPPPMPTKPIPTPKPTLNPKTPVASKIPTAGKEELLQAIRQGQYKLRKTEAAATGTGSSAAAAAAAGQQGPRKVKIAAEKYTDEAMKLTFDVVVNSYFESKSLNDFTYRSPFGGQMLAIQNDVQKGKIDRTDISKFVDFLQKLKRSNLIDANDEKFLTQRFVESVERGLKGIEALVAQEVAGQKVSEGTFAKKTIDVAELKKYIDICTGKLALAKNYLDQLGQDVKTEKIKKAYKTISNMITNAASAALAPTYKAAEGILEQQKKAPQILEAFAQVPAIVYIALAHIDNDLIRSHVIEMIKNKAIPVIENLSLVEKNIDVIRDGLIRVYEKNISKVGEQRAKEEGIQKIKAEIAELEMLLAAAAKQKGSLTASAIPSVDKVAGQLEAKLGMLKSNLAALSAPTSTPKLQAPVPSSSTTTTGPTFKVGSKAEAQVKTYPKPNKPLPTPSIAPAPAPVVPSTTASSVNEAEIQSAGMKKLEWLLDISSDKSVPQAVKDLAAARAQTLLDNQEKEALESAKKTSTSKISPKPSLDSFIREEYSPQVAPQITKPKSPLGSFIKDEYSQVNPKITKPSSTTKISPKVAPQQLKSRVAAAVSKGDLDELLTLQDEVKEYTDLEDAVAKKIDAMLK